MDTSEQFDARSSFMLDHATGALGSELQLAGDLHVMLNADGSDMHDLWSIVGGALLEMGDDEEIAISGAKRMKNASIDTTYIAAKLLSGDQQVAWKRGLFGFDTAHLSPRLGKLLRLAPGRSVIEHDHRTFEATVVLSGELEDGHGVYSTGDILFSWPGMRHKPRAVGDESCVCYVGREKPRMKSWFSKH